MSRKSFRIASFAVAASLVVGAGGAAAMANTSEPAPVAKVSTVPDRPAAAQQDAQARADHERRVAESRDEIMAELTGTRGTGDTREGRLEGARKEPYKYGQPLPMGQHATFTPLWWGMQFTLDPQSAAEFVKALQDGKNIKEMIDKFLPFLGPVGPAVTAVLTTVMKVLDVVLGEVQKNITADGLVINALWIPVAVWTAKPAGPFTPAPARTAAAQKRLATAQQGVAPAQQRVAAVPPRVAPAAKRA